MINHRHAAWSALPECSKTAWLKIKIKTSRIGFRWGQRRRLSRGSCTVRAGVRTFSVLRSVVAQPAWSQQPWGGFGSWPSGQVTQHWISCPSRQFLSVEQIYTRTVTFLSIRKRHILKVLCFFFQGWLAKKAGKGTKPDSPIVKTKISG